MTDAREAGAREARERGPITDRGVIARVAAILRAAMQRHTTLNATNGRTSRTAAVIDDTEDSRERRRSA